MLAKYSRCVPSLTSFETGTERIWSVGFKGGCASAWAAAPAAEAAAWSGFCATAFCAAGAGACFFSTGGKSDGVEARVVNGPAESAAMELTPRRDPDVVLLA